MATRHPNYPHNWNRVTKRIRRAAGYQCERCHIAEGTLDPVTGQPIRLTVHHLGAPYATGKRGNPHDKHDLRRENLQALCPACHAEADRPLYERWQRRMQRRAAGTHALIPSGYGLNPWQGGRA